MRAKSGMTESACSCSSGCRHAKQKRGGRLSRHYVILMLCCKKKLHFNVDYFVSVLCFESAYFCAFKFYFNRVSLCACMCADIPLARASVCLDFLQGLMRA